MSMREEWRYVSTGCGAPFAMGQPGTPTGMFQMQELSVDNWDTKNLASLSGKMCLEHCLM